MAKKTSGVLIGALAVMMSVGSAEAAQCGSSTRSRAAFVVISGWNRETVDKGLLHPSRVEQRLHLRCGVRDLIPSIFSD